VTVRGRTLPLVDPRRPTARWSRWCGRKRSRWLRTPRRVRPLVGTVIAVTFLGATSRVTVDLGDTTIMAQLTTADATALPAGSRVALTIRPDPVLVSASSDPAGSAAEEEA
jgi:hypothetical protein